MSGIEPAAKSAGESLLIPMNRRTLVRAANLMVTLLIAVLSLIKWVLVGSEFLPLTGMILAVLGLCNAAYLSLGGSANVAAYSIITGLTIGLIGGIFNTGGFNGVVVLLAPILPTLSFLLIGPRAGWITAISLAVGLLLVLLLHFFNLVPSTPHDKNVLMIGRFVALASTGLICTWVIWAFAVTATALGQRNELLANTDHLTGIANRRFAERFLDEEIRRAQRSGRDLALIISDVDFFKRYNDCNGHQAGDVCLQQVARVLEKCLQRPADMVGRFGGEEFIAVLPETNADGALAVAERIRQSILDENIPYEPEKSELVSMTLGVTSGRDKEIGSASSMIKLADQALYQGKDQGRNIAVLNLPVGPGAKGRK